MSSPSRRLRRHKIALALPMAVLLSTVIGGPALADDVSGDPSAPADTSQSTPTPDPAPAPEPKPEPKPDPQPAPKDEAPSTDPAPSDKADDKNDDKAGEKAGEKADEKADATDEKSTGKAAEPTAATAPETTTEQAAKSVTQPVQNAFTSAPAAADDESKVIVCKYTETPPGGADHVIVRSVNGIPGFPAEPTFPWLSKDAQDSVAIRFAVGNEQPTDDQIDEFCPVRLPIPTPPVIVKCGPDNDVYGDISIPGIPADAFTIVRNPDRSVTLIADYPRYMFFPASITVTLPPPADANTECPPTVTPPDLTPNDPCGLDNVSWVLPADTADYTAAAANGAVVLTMRPGVNKLFPNGETTWTYPAPVDSGALCPATPPAKPDVTDPCGLTNAYFAEADIPADGVGYTVSTEGDPVTKITITVLPDYEFPQGVESPVVYTATDSGALCPGEPPAKPEVTDPCGLANAYFDDAVIPEDTAAYDVSTSGDPVTTITITANPDYEFPDGVPNPTVYTATDSGALCPATPPVEPEVSDPCGLANAYFAEGDIPADGVGYTVSTEGDPVTKITITVLPDYEFPQGVESPVVYTATDSGALCPATPPVKPEVSDPCGLANAYFAEGDIPADGVGYTVSTEGDPVTKITITVLPDYEFPDGVESPVVYTATDSGALCPAPVPVKPAVSDPCGPGNAFFADADLAAIKALDPDVYVVELTGNPVTKVEISTTADYELEGDVSAPLVFEATDSGVVCLVAPALAPNDPCGPANATWIAPTPTADFTVSVVGGVIKLVAAVGKAFEGNQPTYTYPAAAPVDSNVVCEVAGVEEAKPPKNEVGGVKAAAGLPNTGGPAGWLMPLGVGLVLAGAALVLGRRGERA